MLGSALSIAVGFYLAEERRPARPHPIAHRLAERLHVIATRLWS